MCKAAQIACPLLVMPSFKALPNVKILSQNLNESDDSHKMEDTLKTEEPSAK
jgi:hypothetical protein